MTIREFPAIDGIHSIVLPLTGFGDLLTSNIFVLGRGPVTLIDTGPKFSGSFNALRSGLNSAGFDFPDVERIIITHGHIDHFGMAAMIIREAGHPVPCHIHKDDIWRTKDDYIKKGLWSDEVMDFIRMAGMPDLAVERMKRRSAFFKHFCDPLERAIPMQDGDTFTDTGFCLRVIHTPGHSPGSCCLLEEQSRVLFTGDHIIKHITPNPIMELRRSLLSNPGYQSLQAYGASLDKVLDLDVRYGFSGHGEYIDDIKGLIAGYREHHERRKEQILTVLSGKELPIYDMVGPLFPDIPENEIFLAVSEVYSHLEVLINEGRARMTKTGTPSLFSAVS